MNKSIVERHKDMDNELTRFKKTLEENMKHQEEFQKAMVTSSTFLMKSQQENTARVDNQFNNVENRFNNLEKGMDSILTMLQSMYNTNEKNKHPEKANPNGKEDMKD